MKRNVSFLLILVLMTLLLGGCGNTNKISLVNYGNIDKTEENYRTSIILDFLKKMYNVDNYKKINIKQLNVQYPKDKYTNELRKIATEEALEPFIAERLQLLYITYCCDLHVNSLLTSSRIGKYTTEQDGSMVYNFDGKVRLTFTDENKQSEEDIRGQVTVQKINGKWAIIKFNDVSIGNIARYYKNSKQ